MPDIDRPPAAGNLSISRKVILLFAALALAGAGSWLVVHRALTRLDGAATDINRYGSLRFLSQKVQVVLHDIAHGVRDPGEVERLVAEFETTLKGLQASRAGAGTDEGVGQALTAVEMRWAAYRAAVHRFIGKGAARADHVAELHALSVMAEQLLDEANRATWLLSDGIARLEEKARGDLVRLALLDAALLLFAYAYIRRRVAQPLRGVAGAMLRFAGGDRAARSGFRSGDEIGRLAEAFDRMAEETERHIGVIAADLEAIRRKEAELRKLSQAIEHSPASVMITDAAGVIEYVNPRFTEVSGYTRAEAVGRTPGLLKSGQTLPETYRGLWQVLLDGGVWRGELLNRRKNGELFWENTQISPVKSDGGAITHFVAVKEDVTARKHAEQSLALLNIELEQRVAARTRELEAANRELQAFSYSVSHDLRAPLRAIHGFAHAIEDEGGSRLDGELRDYLQRIQAAAVRMGELIDDLLELGRVGQTEVMAMPVDLSRMARELLDGLAAAEPGRRVDIEVEDNVVVLGDPRLLRIALGNLLGNAWKFTAGRNPARIVFGRGRRRGRDMLMVSDNGAGFNMEYADKLFRPFQRLHAANRFPGTGIGLATAKRIVEMHGGRIEAEGAVDGGAAFYFEIPDAPERDGGVSVEIPTRGKNAA